MFRFLQPFTSENFCLAELLNNTMIQGKLQVGLNLGRKTYIQESIRSQYEKYRLFPEQMEGENVQPDNGWKTLALFVLAPTRMKPHQNTLTLRLQHGNHLKEDLSTLPSIKLRELLCAASLERLVYFRLTYQSLQHRMILNNKLQNYH